MASKQVIETNKLKIGSGASKGLYVGNTESFYAVITNSAKTKTVVYDKVTYDFVVNNISGTVPASGASYSINVQTTTRTHGNGTTDTVTYSPTTVTIPANTGSSYSSSVTVTQTTSNLTGSCSYTVAADSVKSIALSLSSPSVIPASGGSVASCTTSATVTYQSGRKVTTFTPTKVQFGTAVSASSKGTTASSVTTAGTLNCWISYGGVTSNTASIAVTQQANSSSDSWNAPSITAFSYAQIPAAGGSKTPSVTASQSGTRTWTSTATSAITGTVTYSYAMTNGNGFTLKSTSIKIKKCL